MLVTRASGGVGSAVVQLAKRRGAYVIAVAGDQVGTLLKLMARGGRYASSGAIAGPITTIDIRDFYLKDLTLIGCTAWDEPIFSNLIGCIEKGEIRPLVAKTFELKDIATAQQEFLKKTHFGNFVLVPPL